MQNRRQRRRQRREESRSNASLDPHPTSTAVRTRNVSSETRRPSFRPPVLKNLAERSEDGRSGAIEGEPRIPHTPRLPAKAEASNHHRQFPCVLAPEDLLWRPDPIARDAYGDLLASVRIPECGGHGE